MRILLIHSDHFEYEVKQQAIKSPEQITPDQKRGTMDEALVAFCTVEKVDEKGPEEVVSKAVDAIDEVAKWVKAKNVMLYPYAHLSSELGQRDLAIPILEAMEQALREKGYTVARSPFGWYKSFTIQCKGHPLSELSRTITPSQVAVAEEEEKAKPEEKEASTFLVLEADGNEHPLDLSNIDACKALERYPLLRQFILSEEVGAVPHEAPPHIALMRRLELVDYEPASDIGHFRFYPKGALVKELLERLATDTAIKDLGAMRIDTPLLYRLDQPDIASQAARFRERDYRFEADERELTLRFAGDFGLFRMMRDATVSYKQLPLRIYELSPSFRLEQRGECVGLKRLRAFTMPDIHCFCKDLQQGKVEYMELFRHYTHLTEAMGIDYAVAFRVFKDFYVENRQWFADLLRIADKPALIELLPERKHYWILKHEYQAVDSVGGNAQLCTVQLDVEDSERYGIMYVDEDGGKKGCIILHSSLGSIERWIYAILEQAEKMRKVGKPPTFPVWLNPTQVRVVPVSRNYLNYAKEVADAVEKRGVRVDVDDRDETLGSKVRDAEVEWIPYVVVVGEKEAKNGMASVRIRGGKKQEMMRVEVLAELVDKATGSMPRAPMYLPRLLSMKPKFI